MNFIDPICVSFISSRIAPDLRSRSYLEGKLFERQCNLEAENPPVKRFLYLSQGHNYQSPPFPALLPRTQTFYHSIAMRKTHMSIAYQDHKDPITTIIITPAAKHHHSVLLDNDLLFQASIISLPFEGDGLRVVQKLRLKIRILLRSLTTVEQHQTLPHRLRTMLSHIQISRNRFQVVQTHSSLGYVLLRKLSHLLQRCVEIADSLDSSRIR